MSYHYYDKSIPLYARVAAILNNKITRGQLQPGQKLKKEKELAVELGVSRITIRHALALLEKEDLIVRKRAAGTFISKNVPLKKQKIVSGSIYDIVVEAEEFQVHPLGMKNILVEEASIARDIHDFFGLNNKDQITWIQRLRLKNLEPVYFLENFIPMEYSHVLNLKNLEEKPLLKIMKEESNLIVSRGEMFIESIPADAEISKILKTGLFDPLIFFQVFCWLDSDKPFEIANLYMRPEYFKYKVVLNSEGYGKI
jgi:GntR family transcriptional regulator